MSEIKLLVTGHSIVGKESVCSVSNFDYYWLFNHPSLLLWADKVIITPYMDEVIDSASHPDNNGPISKLIKNTFEIARTYDLIEVKDPTKIINSKLSDKILEEINKDSEILSEMFPEDVTIDEEDLHGAVCLDNTKFCIPYLWSIYVSLILSKKWKAQCLFTDGILELLKYKFGSSLATPNEINSIPRSFNTVFNPILPEYNIGANLLGTKCMDCFHLEKCEDISKSKLEESLSNYLDLRDYDELHQLKETLLKIIKSLKSKKDITYEDIIHEFKSSERSIKRRMHSTFPQVKRWTNLALMTSIPITAVGAYTGLPAVCATGMAVGGVSKLTEKYIKHLESKYNWIGFKIDNL